MKLWEVWLIPLFYRRFFRSPDGRFYWVFRIDLVDHFPFISINCFKHENTM